MAHPSWSRRQGYQGSRGKRSKLSQPTHWLNH